LVVGVRVGYQKRTDIFESESEAQERIQDMLVGIKGRNTIEGVQGHDPLEKF